jgi:hypothetical protein
VSAARRRRRAYFRKLEQGFRCPGCGELARYRDTDSGGREWYMLHDAACPGLTEEQRATAFTVTED